MAVAQNCGQWHDLMSEELNFRVQLPCRVAIPDALQSYAYILSKSNIIHTWYIKHFTSIALNFHSTTEIHKTAVLILITVHKTGVINNGIIFVPNCIKISRLILQLLGHTYTHTHTHTQWHTSKKRLLCQRSSAKNMYCPNFLWKPAYFMEAYVHLLHLKHTVEKLITLTPTCRMIKILFPVLALRC